MIGRERILQTFQGGVPDRIPLFEQSVAGGVVSEILGRPALGFASDLHYHEAQSRLAGASAYEDFIGRWKEDYAAFVRALDMDMVAAPWFLWETPVRRLDEFAFLYRNEDGEYVRSYEPRSQTFSLARAECGVNTNALRAKIRKTLREDNGQNYDGGYWALLKWLIETFGNERCVAGASFFAIPMRADWLMLLLEDAGLVREYLDFVAERDVDAIRKQAEMGVRVFNGGGDLAANSGPLYSPALFREVALPGLKKIIASAHSRDGFYIFRTDGNIRAMEDLLFEEAGADAYGEIDIDAGMDLIELRRRRPQLVLWGGLACGSLLLNGAEREIVNEARRLRNALRSGGRWIFASSNTLLPGTNTRGYLAALREVRQ